MSRPERRSLKLGKLSWLGLILVLSYPITSIVSFALFAILIGETALESDLGQVTPLGNLVQLLPALLGAVLFGVGLVYKPELRNISGWVAATGIVLILVSLLAVVLDPGTGGANIGAGILLMVGTALLLVGVAGMVIRTLRRPAES